eukprot:COSAG01_NODE_8784_length_2660_cov_7.194846_3_plen_94_part_00
MLRTVHRYITIITMHAPKTKREGVCTAHTPARTGAWSTGTCGRPVWQRCGYRLGTGSPAAPSSAGCIMAGHRACHIASKPSRRQYVAGPDMYH